MSVNLTLGAEPKKVAWLVGLLVVAGVSYWYFSRPDKSSAGDAKPATARTALKQALQPADVEADSVSAPKSAAAAPGQAASREFRPTLKRKAGEFVDPEHFDPTLRQDLLDRLATVRVERVERSLFDFSSSAGSAAGPRLPEPKIVVQKPSFRKQGPELPPPPQPPPPPPPPPPIPLKFYGRALPLPNGVKRVFCIINEEVFVASEGELVQRRYRIEKVNPTSVVVEDVNYKNRQTLPIEEPAPGNS